MENNYYLALLIVMAIFGIPAIIIYFLYSWYKEKRLKKILQQPFPKEFEKVLSELPLYQKLSSNDKKKIAQNILLFIDTKEFIGVYLNITDEMKVVIAFHACLLLLHSDVSQCYENLGTIIVYPNRIIANQIINNGGIYTKGDFLLEGQSSSDTVVLAWNDVKKDAYHLQHNNVIIHEFAHELDFLNGVADGTPPLPYSKYHEWAKVLSDDFNRLVDINLKNRNWGKYKMIGSYAATNEAEFFAVVTERYFEEPEKLKKDFPELYKELNMFYNIYD